MSAEQLCRAILPLIKPYKTLTTASLPEYVAIHSHQTDYLAPLRTRQYTALLLATMSHILADINRDQKKKKIKRNVTVKHLVCTYLCNLCNASRGHLQQNRLGLKIDQCWVPEGMGVAMLSSQREQKGSQAVVMSLRCEQQSCFIGVCEAVWKLLVLVQQGVRCALPICTWVLMVLGFFWVRECTVSYIYVYLLVSKPAATTKKEDANGKCDGSPLLLRAKCCRLKFRFLQSWQISLIKQRDQ